VAISGAGSTTFSVTGGCTNTSVQGTVTVDPNATGSSPSVNATLTLTSGGYGQGFQSAPGGSPQAPFPGVEVLAAPAAITAILPAQGMAGYQQSVTFAGSNFGTAPPQIRHRSLSHPQPETPRPLPRPFSSRFPQP
jgi:hypothetical protein